VKGYISYTWVRWTPPTQTIPDAALGLPANVTVDPTLLTECRAVVSGLLCGTDYTFKVAGVRVAEPADVGTASVPAVQLVGPFSDASNYVSTLSLADDYKQFVAERGIMETECSQLRRKLKDAETKLSDAERRLTGGSEQEKTRVREREDRDKQLKLTEEKLDDMMRRMRGAESAAADARAAASEADKARAEAVRQLADAQGKLTRQTELYEAAEESRRRVEEDVLRTAEGASAQSALVAEHRAQIDKLAAEGIELRSRLQQCQATLEAAEQQHAAAVQEIQATKSALDHVRKMCEALNARNAELAAELTESKRQSEDAAADAQSARDACALLRAQVEDARDAVITSASKSTVISAEGALLRSERDALRNDCDALRQENDVLRKRVDANVMSAASASSKEEAIQLQLAETKQHLAALKSQNEAQALRIAELDARGADELGWKVQYEQLAVQAKEREATDRDKFAALVSKTQLMEARLLDVHGKNEALDNAVKMLSDALSSREASINAQNASITELNEFCRARDREIASLNERLHHAHAMSIREAERAAQLHMQVIRFGSLEAENERLRGIALALSGPVNASAHRVSAADNAELARTLAAPQLAIGVELRAMGFSLEQCADAARKFDSVSRAVAYLTPGKGILVAPAY
jgi:chromosome segregation ATPase